MRRVRLALQRVPYSPQLAWFLLVSAKDAVGQAQRAANRLRQLMDPAEGQRYCGQLTRQEASVRTRGPGWTCARTRLLPNLVEFAARPARSGAARGAGESPRCSCQEFLRRHQQ